MYLSVHSPPVVYADMLLGSIVEGRDDPQLAKGC